MRFGRLDDPVRRPGAPAPTVDGRPVAVGGRADRARAARAGPRAVHRGRAHRPARHRPRAAAPGRAWTSTRWPATSPATTPRSPGCRRRGAQRPLEEALADRRAVRRGHRGPAVGAARRGRAVPGGPGARDRRRRRRARRSCRCLDVVAAAHLLPGGSAVLQVGPAEQAAHEPRRCLGVSSSLVEVRTFPRGSLLRIDRRQGRSFAGQHLVGAVAPGLRRGLAAPAHALHRAGRPVRDAVVVLDDVVAAQQHRPAGAEDHVGVLVGRDSVTPPPPTASSIRRATRSSRSRQVNAPNKTSSASVGSASTSAPQMLRTASCSWTASASTCSV